MLSPIAVQSVVSDRSQTKTTAKQPTDRRNVLHTISKQTTMSDSYDSSVALDRKLTPEESRELKIALMPYFHATGGDNEASPEDINDLLDYAFAMVNNQKSVDHVIKELVGMEMDFCNSTIAEKLGGVLSEFLKKALGGGDDEKTASGKVASLKVRYSAFFLIVLHKTAMERVVLKQFVSGLAIDVLTVFSFHI